jgi:hypothetical protein
VNKDELVYECFVMRRCDPDFSKYTDKSYLSKLQAMSKIDLEEHRLFLEVEKMNQFV